MRCPCGSGLSVGNCQHYKEGDRVEAIKPPTGVEDSQADQIGLGEITAIDLGAQNGETHKVMLDSGEEWWYSEDRLRPAPIATPTPSITVGTQVRLTGVVSKVDSAATAKHIGVKFANSEDEPLLWFSSGEVEVIRQPFKRGEVVWSCGAVATGEQYVVFNDENNGRVDVVHCDTGTATKGNDASRFERRP